MKLSTKQTLAIALLAGSTLSVIPALAQTSGSGGSQGGAGATTPIIPGQGAAGSGASSGGAASGSGSMQNQAQPSQGAATQQPQGQGSAQGSGSMNAEGKSADPRLKKQGDSAQQQPAEKSGQTDGSNTANSSGAADKDPRNPATTTDSARQNNSTTNGGAPQNDTNQAATDRPSNETTGSINISTEQRTEVRNILVQNKVEPVDVDVDVSVGVAVPTTVELHPLPPRIVEIVPAYRGYEYFVLADGRIIIVEPSTHEVVYILTS
ncbi:DUF1236 domain-containing protein [Rhizobium terrae]|uniref:DUF1236 domain-containing protein n=1 Tax=Rhizobium terrae TaxID=2171756 RepID=UPI000E3E26B0|nr:DUF1236 domain-containing protein [Rhizobium terrae]